MKKTFLFLLLYLTYITIFMFSCSGEDKAPILSSSSSQSSSSSSSTASDLIAPTVTIQNPGAGATLNTTNISISGTAIDNNQVAAVYLKIDSMPFIALSPTAGNWTTNIILSEGAHTILVYATDTNNNFSSTNSRSFSIDLDAPSVAFTKPLHNHFTNIAAITIEGTASINSGTITGVQLKNNSSSFSAASSSDNWAHWTKALTLSEGTNRITAQVNANSGKSSTVSMDIILDTQGPVITTVTPKESKTRFEATENFYFRVSTQTDTAGIKKIVVLKDGSPFTEKTVSLASLNNEYVSISALNSAATHQFDIYVVDSLGNCSTTNRTAITTFYAPVIAITTPANNSLNNQSSIAVTGTATITSGSITQVRVKVGDSGSWISATSSNSWATWNATVAINEGNNKIIAETTSAAGDTHSWYVWVYSDRTKPTATIASPANNSAYETNNQVAISISSSDDHSSVNSLIVLVNGSEFTNISNPNSTQQVIYPGFYSAGNHTISAYTRDGAGNYSATNTITVTATEPFLQVSGITWATGGAGSGTLSGDSTLSVDATLYYVVVNKGYPPTAAQLKAGVDYTSGSENVTVLHKNSYSYTAGSAWFGDYISGLTPDIWVHVYCVAETSGGQFSKVRFAGSFKCNSTTTLPIMDTLIFSEYIEGSGDNKALEIYNGTGKPVELDKYWIHIYLNSMSVPFGSGWAAGRTDAVLGHGQSYVFCNSGANSAITSVAQKSVGSLDYNGNDSIVLLNPDGIVIDSIGKIGENPSSSTGWQGSGVQTVDRTLRRKLTVRRGDDNPNDSFDPSIEWVSHSTDTFNGLGSWQE